jgi:hypothetical protein
MELIISASDVIKTDYIEIYLIERESIRKRLSNAANNLFILQKLSDFPYHLFAPRSEDQHYWNATYNALIKDTILALCHVNWDGDKHSDDSGELRLSRFENKIMRDWIRDDIDSSVRDELSRRLKSNQLNKKHIDKLREKLLKIRNEIIAHIDYKTAQGSIMSPDHKITVPELKKLLSYCNNWFQLLCLEIYCDLNVWEYHEGAKWSDIDQILCLVASNSIYLKSFSHEWQIDTQREDLEKLSDADRQLLDTWRAKIQTTIY